MEKNKRENTMEEQFNTLRSYDELSDFIEQHLPFSKEEISYLKHNLGRIIKNKNRIESDSSIIRFYLSIQKILPHSHHLISLLFQLDQEEVARSFIKEQKNNIIPILEYTFIQSVSIEEYHDYFEQDTNSSIQDIIFDNLGLENIVLYTEYSNKNVILAFIEELLPYLCIPNFSLEGNLSFLFQEEEELLQYGKEHYFQRKTPINILFQTVNDNSSILLYYLMKHIDEIEFEITGKERLNSIKEILRHPNIEAKKEVFKRKILDTITPSKEFIHPNVPRGIGIISFMQNILYLQEEAEKGNPYFESDLYQNCLKSLFYLYKFEIEESEQLKNKLEEYFKNKIIKDSLKETNPLKRKEDLLNTLSELLKINSKNELFTFLKIGIYLYQSNAYTMEQLDSYDSDDFFKLLKIMKEKWLIEEQMTLTSLILLGKEISFSGVKVLDDKNYAAVLDVVSKSSKEERESFLPLLQGILQLIEKYQENIPYKNTELQEKVFSLYKTWVTKKQKIEGVDQKKIEFIFHKIIQTGDLKTYLLNIDNLKKLVLAYKTIYLNIEENDFTMEQIEQLNSKQLNDIRRKVISLYKKEQIDPRRILESNKYIEKEINTLSLKLISYLDYELAKQILKDPDLTFPKLNSFLSGFKNPLKQIDGFKKCLRNQIHIFDLEEELLKNYYNWYCDLSTYLKKSATYYDIINYEGGTKEKIFEKACYFPICKNILEIKGGNNWKRNSYKTTYLWEQQLKRIRSTIPEVEGKIGKYRYQMVDLHDPELIFLPNKINCCMEIGGKAEADLIHAVTNPNGRLFAIYQGNEVKAISWVWRNNQILCFDNIEVKRGEETKEFGKIIKEILIQASNNLIEISRKSEPSREAIRTITLGRNPRDIPIELEKRNLLSNYQENMYKPKEEEKLYLIDSEKIQYIIGGSYSTEKEHDLTTVYLCPRKEAKKFEDLDNFYLDTMIESLYEKNGIKKKPNVYLLGYLGEDFFVGVTKSGKIELTYLPTDNRVEKDVIDALEKVKEEYQQKSRIEQEREKISNEIISRIYDIEETKVTQILEEISQGIPYAIDKDFYYHGGSLKDIAGILGKGEIDCNYNLGRRKNGGSNGNYYICVAKNLQIPNGSFNAYVKNDTSIILQKNLPVLDKNTREFNFLSSFFEEEKRKKYNYEDEFQVKDKIELPYFEGIYVPVKTKEDLIMVRKIIDLLEIFQRQLPVINSTSNTLIDPQLIKTYAILK